MTKIAEIYDLSYFYKHLKRSIAFINKNDTTVLNFEEGRFVVKDISPDNTTVSKIEFLDDDDRFKFLQDEQICVSVSGLKQVFKEAKKYGENHIFKKDNYLKVKNKKFSAKIPLYEDYEGSEEIIDDLLPNMKEKLKEHKFETKTENFTDVFSIIDNLNLEELTISSSDNVITIDAGEDNNKIDGEPFEIDKSLTDTSVRVQTSLIYPLMKKFGANTTVAFLSDTPIYLAYTTSNRSLEYLVAPRVDLE